MGRDAANSPQDQDPQDPPQPEHRIIVTRYDPQAILRNRKRVYFRCQVPKCLQGHVDLQPADKCQEIIEAIQADHLRRAANEPPPAPTRRRRRGKRDP